VADAITVPLAGWLTSRVGPARTFLVALCGFGLASVLCGLSTSLATLVMFRIIQGLAGGPLIPISQTLLLGIFPKHKSNTAMAIWAMTAVIGPILGPILGGIICEHLTWPWIFFINAPFALLGAVSCWRLLIPRDPPPERRPVDVVGLGLMITWIGALQIVLDRGPDLDWFGSPMITSLAIIAVVGLISFVIWELTDDHPIVDLRIFRHPGYATVLAILGIDLGAFFGFVLILTLWLQTNMGYTPTLAAYTIAPGGLIVFVLTPLVAWLSARIDLRLMISLGLLAFAGVLFWQSSFSTNVTFAMIVAGEFGIGVAAALFFTPIFTLGLSFVTPAEVPAAAGLLAFTRTAATAFATALATTAWQDSATRSRVGLIDHFQGTGALGQIGAAGFKGEQALQFLDNLVQNQAVMLATNHAVFAVAAIMLSGAFVIWSVPRARSGVSVTGH
jgi:DHA2 family multidrug resistance protein